MRAWLKRGGRYRIRQRDDPAVQHCLQRHILTDGILRGSFDASVADLRALFDIGRDLRRSIIDRDRGGCRRAGNGVRAIRQRSGIQRIAQGIERILRDRKGHIEDLGLACAISHADLGFRRIVFQWLRVLRMPVVRGMFDGADAAHASIRYRTQARAIRQDHADVLQDKVIVVLDVMLQRIGLVSGMESNRELTALRVEIACVDVIVIRDPAVICAFIEHADEVIADGHGVFEEDIGL